VSETRRLGRGLEALLGPLTREEVQAQGGAREIPVSAIDPNPYQPRRTFEPLALQELADSIKASGLLQPIAVRPRPGGRYELIAGERRWRAAQQLGWARIPAVVREVDDRSLLTLALIENLQRDDLSPLDAARGYQRLMQEFAIAQQEVARLVGKDRSTVSNTLRLLRLPEEIQGLLEQRRITEGHARALLGLADPQEMVRFGRECAEQDWSVRDLEARVRGDSLPSGSALPSPRRRIRRAQPDGRSASAEIRRVEDALRKRLQTDVRVTARRRGRGAVTIHYYSNEDLVRVLELILGGPYHG
jgi:ParB family chromosome partitioning protein